MNDQTEANDESRAEGQSLLNDRLERELLPCPFCGCEMYFFSNQDWHKIRGAHEDNCIFDWDSDTLMVSATDEQKELAKADWNTRSNVKVRGAEPRFSAERPS